VLHSLSSLSNPHFFALSITLPNCSTNHFEWSKQLCERWQNASERDVAIYKQIFDSSVGKVDPSSVNIPEMTLSTKLIRASCLSAVACTAAISEMEVTVALGLSGEVRIVHVRKCHFKSYVQRYILLWFCILTP